MFSYQRRLIELDRQRDERREDDAVQFFDANASLCKQEQFLSLMLRHYEGIPYLLDSTPRKVFMRSIVKAGCIIVKKKGDSSGMHQQIYLKQQPVCPACVCLFSSEGYPIPYTLSQAILCPGS